MGTFIEEKINSHYGSWTVLDFHKIDKHGDARWFCRCEICGDIYSVRGFALRNRQSTKCKKCVRRRRERD